MYKRQGRVFAAEAGRRIAAEGFALCSGGAAGADRAAQDACLAHGGSAVIRRHPDLLLLVEAPPQELTDVDTPQALEVLTGEKCR